MKDEGTKAGRQQWSHMAPVLVLRGDRIRVEGLEVDVTDLRHISTPTGLVVVLHMAGEGRKAYVHKFDAHDRVEVLRFRGELEGDRAVAAMREEARDVNA